MKLCLLVATALLHPGCYLGHVASGQLDLLQKSQPIETLLADPQTPDSTRSGLELVLEARSYASELGLDVDGQYTHYAEWPGDRLVTSVVATRPGELEPAGFWFPIVGRVPYKGYFTAERAEAEAASLRAEGYDVCVTPVRAYSTLGWFADPITGPMLRQEPGRLVETVVHELVHASVYAPGHADFNESIATFIGEEARIAFFAARDGSPGEARERGRVDATRAYRALLEELRAELAALYSADGRGDVQALARDGLVGETRARIESLPSLRDPERAARDARLNDACLALSGTYSAHLAAYAKLVESRGLTLAELIELAAAAAATDAPLESLGLP